MAFVRQRNKRDCGVAALAMLCDVTYEEAEKAIPWRREGCLEGTTAKMLREGAEKFGYQTHSTPQNRLKPIRAPKEPEGWSTMDVWDMIPDNSLVKIANPKGPNHGFHWVVWRKNKIYDPACGVFRIYWALPLSYMIFIDWNK